MQKLIDVLQAHGIAIVPDFSQAKQRNGSQWVFARQVDVGSTIVQVVDYGDFKTDIAHRWFSTDRLSPEETRELNKKLNEATEELKAFKKEQWDIAREYAKAFIQTCADRGSTEYLDRKKVALHRGAYIHTHPTSGSLVVIVPLMDVSGEIWSYQRIFPKKLSFGDKFMQEGGRIEGLFFPFGFDPSAETPFEIYIAEGYATAATIFETISAPTVAAINAWNIIAVAKALREKFPAARLIICADNDAWTVKKTKDGIDQPYNTGLFYSKRAADETKGELRYPAFQDTTSKPTDFNDLYLQEGANAVREQLKNAKEAPLLAAILEDSKVEKVKKKSIEYLVATSLLNEYGENICKQKRDVFIYNGTHWDHLDQIDAENYFRNRIESATGNTLSFKQITETWKRLLMLIPSIPPGRNIFEPNPYAQNFKNGTLHLTPKLEGGFELTFKDFNRADYLLYKHPFNYDENAPINEDFEASLNRVWAGDPDIELKKNAYYEILGASLVPAFRKVALFVGPPGSGKSTLILFAVHMVHQSMRCSVDPTDFAGFSLESMAGKLLNYDTDITLTKTLSDSVLKKVEDRIAIRVKRKNQIDIVSVIPGVHLFGANRMPLSHDGPEAYARRMLIFKCSAYKATGSDYTQDFAVRTWEKNPQGIVARAIEGLKRVCANRGHFTVPESSAVSMQEWKNSHMDVVEEFLLELRAGEVEFSDKNDQMKAASEGKISAKILWKLFISWFENCHPKDRPPGKHAVFRRLKELGIRDAHSENERFYSGFSVDVAPNAMN